MSNPFDFTHRFPGYIGAFGAPSHHTPEQSLRLEVDELRKRFNSLDTPSTLIGTVTEVKEKNGRRFATFAVGMQTVQCELSSWSAEARPGMCVRLTREKLQPIEYCEHPPARGVIVVVDKVHENGTIEYVQLGQPNQVLVCGVECKPGDRVLIDPSGNVGIRNMGRAETSSKQVYAGETGVTWDDVGGQEEAKRLLIEAIEEPTTRSAHYERYGKKPCKGILLCGPSGTGKTLLGKAAATALERVHGKTASGSGFLYSAGPELIGLTVGSSEANIRAMFAAAREHRERHGYPAIIFLDEADSVLAHRGKGPRADNAGMDKVGDSMTMTFLAEMDGISTHAAIVIAATNRPAAIDPAFLRHGRIDRKIEVGRPTQSDCVEIFAKCLLGKPIDVPMGVTELEAVRTISRVAADELFSDRHVLGMSANAAPTSALAIVGGARSRVPLSSVVSGAMVAGIVEQATQLAIRRAIAGDDKGILREDLRDAIAQVHREEKLVGSGVAS